MFRFAPFWEMTFSGILEHLKSVYNNLSLCMHVPNFEPATNF